ncbi:MAG: Xaa-Pro peptidase family protein [Candidatus Omnitrophota bacterium]
MPVKKVTDDMPDRLRALADGFLSAGVDALLVTADSDLHYLTRYPARDAWLLITSARAYYITDARYISEVSHVIRGVAVVRFEKSLADEVMRILHKAGAKRLGVNERHLTVSQYNKLKVLSAGKVVLKAADGCVTALRVIKDSEELALIRQAIELDLAAYRYIEKFIQPGVTENALLKKLEGFVRRHSAGFAFDPIIASGPNSAFPHARVTDRQLCHNDTVLIDLGMDIKGYKSDLTRMFFLGKMQPSYKRILAVLKESQGEALRFIKPGVLAKDVDARVRSFLKGHGLAEYFNHSLGHGVGLDIHELPRLSVKSDMVLEENMVCTVEPGVYFPGKYGIRLEEMVLITKNGCEVLSGNHNQ